jgi:hypothetical protein
MKKFIFTTVFLVFSALLFGAEGVSLLSFSEKAEQYGVAEFSVKCTEKLNNPFWDASLNSSWETPSGKKLNAEGFFDGDGVYRLRFAPLETGNYKYKISFKAGGTEKLFEGTLVSVPGKKAGFLRVSKENSFRFATDNGEAFYPVGIQTCGYLDEPSTVMSFEKNRWASPKEEKVTPEAYFKEFEGGANIYRVQFGPGDKAGCAADPMESGSLDKYNLELLRKTDELYKTFTAKNFHGITIFFQDMSRWGNPEKDKKIAFGSMRKTDGYKNMQNAELYAAAKKYMRYIVARYAAYTDIWEFFNEDDYTPDEWLNETAAFVKDLDPYKHLMTTNYERPYLDWCDLVTPHEYMSMDSTNVDQHLAKEGCRFKHFKKPVLYTEFGNQSELGNQGRNKWRVAVWSTFFNEIALLFWDMTRPVYTSGENPGPINAFLGPTERKDLKVFQKFVKDIPAGARTIGVYPDEESEIRGYGLATDNMVWGYVNHKSSHADKISGLKVKVETGFGNWSVKWINTTKGEKIGEEIIIKSSGRCTDLEIPKIKVDAAFVMKKIN